MHFSVYVCMNERTRVSGLASFRFACCCCCSHFRRQETNIYVYIYIYFFLNTHICIYSVFPAIPKYVFLFFYSCFELIKNYITEKKIKKEKKRNN